MRKLLASLLTASMLIGMMGMTAFAQEEPENLESLPEATDGAELENNENEENGEADLGPTVFKAAADIVPQAEGYNIRARLNEELADAKFVGIVASIVNGEPTEVVGRVGADYVATLNIPNAEVNANSLWLGVGMNNVDSLGGGKGVHALGEFHLLGEDKNLPLFDTFENFGLTNLKAFKSATVNANIVDMDGKSHPVTYVFTGDYSDASGLEVVAEPDSYDNVSAAWHSMVNENNFVVDRNTGVDDSQIVIGNGSWLQIGGKKLQFEPDEKGDIVLFKSGEATTVQEILDMVQLVDADNGETLSFCLTAGTSLGVSTSSATLAKDVNVTVDGFTAEQLTDKNGKNILVALQEAVHSDPDTAKSAMIQLATLLDKFIGLVNENEIDVTISFAEESQNEGYNIRAKLNELLNGAKFAGVIASTLPNGQTTEVVGTVDADYVATLNIPNAKVNPNSLWLGIGMRDVASLGGNGVHALGEFHLIGYDNEGINIFDTLNGAGFNALKNFGGATVNAAIIGVDGTETPVTYTFVGQWTEADGKTITATPDDGVSAAWHNMVNDKNFEINRNNPDDSQIVIANGSWLQIGNDKLQFAATAEGDIILFTEKGDNVQSILDKVELVTEDNNALAFHLEKGTMLGVSTSSAALKHDVDVTVTGLTEGKLTETGLDTFLKDLQTAVNNPEGGNKDAIIALAGLMDKVVTLVDGENVNVEIKFACDHIPNEAVRENEVEAACTTDGSYDEVVYCSVCGTELSRETVTVNAYGHEYGEPQLVAGSDRTAYRECAVCEDRVYATVTVTNERVVVEPTHEVQGWMSYTGVFSFGEGVELEHQWYELIPALNHQNVVIDEAVEPTCTETGLTQGSHCGDCGEVFVEQIVLPALGHSYGESVLADDHATVSRTCSRCNETETAEVTGVTSEVTIPATRREPGLRTYTGTATYADDTAVTVTWTEVIPRLPSGGGSSSGGSTVVIDPDDVPLADRPMTFEDVKEEDWFHEAVQFVFNKGLMEGESETAFEPYINTTRAMVAQILYRMEGSPSVADIKDVEIPDVTVDNWYHDAAVWAYSTGVYKGLDEKGTFGGDVNITREQLVEVLYRFAVSKKYAVTDENDLSAFEDKDDVGTWAERAMKWAVGAGIIEGRTETHIVPQDNAQRCELAMILMRFENRFAPTEEKK